jgi:prepilin peptidase CpaA
MGMDTTSELKAFLELAGMLFTEPRIAVLLALLAIAAVTDFRTFRIPNWVTGGGIAFALVYSLFTPIGGPSLSGALGGMLLGFLITVPMYALRTMGAGDVKLVAMIGAFLGPQGVLFAILFSFITAGAAAIAFASANGALKRMFGNVRAIAEGVAWSTLGGVRPVARLEPGSSVGSLAFGISIAIGTSGYVVARHFYLI